MRWPRKPAAPVMVIVMLRSDGARNAWGGCRAFAEALCWLGEIGKDRNLNFKKFVQRGKVQAPVRVAMAAARGGVRFSYALCFSFQLDAGSCLVGG